jgi:hypothetical protein
MNAKITLGVVVMITLVTTTAIAAATMLTTQSSFAKRGTGIPASPFTSGENVYIVWGSNKTGHPEVMFRASTDGGQTFNDKINLSNSSDTDSTDVAISAGGGRVTITWWETNETSEEPLVRTSTDNGETFGPVLKLATNGTIGEGTEEGK